MDWWKTQPIWILSPGFTPIPDASILKLFPDMWIPSFSKTICAHCTVLSIAQSRKRTSSVRKCAGVHKIIFKHNTKIRPSPKTLKPYVSGVWTSKRKSKALKCCSRWQWKRAKLVKLLLKISELQKLQERARSYELPFCAKKNPWLRLEHITQMEVAEILRAAVKLHKKAKIPSHVCNKKGKHDFLLCNLTGMGQRSLASKQPAVPGQQ